MAARLSQTTRFQSARGETKNYESELCRRALVATSTPLHLGRGIMTSGVNGKLLPLLDPFPSNDTSKRLPQSRRLECDFHGVIGSNSAN